MYATGAVCDQHAAEPAVWVISLPSGRMLTMCNHHLEVNREALLRDGALIYRLND